MIGGGDKNNVMVDTTKGDYISLRFTPTLLLYSTVSANVSILRRTFVARHNVHYLQLEN